MKEIDQPKKPKWELSEAAFKLLLDWLDPDPQRAAEEYEKLHRDLVDYLSRRSHQISPEVLADATFDRIAQKLEKGAALPTGAHKAYCRGVARLLLLEFMRRPENVFGAEEIESQKLSWQLFKQSLEEEKAHGWSERMSECLHECLRQMKPKDRELLLLYYGGDGEPARQRNRQKLAAKLKLSYSNLRTRASRLRAKVEQRVKRCLERGDT
jgi:DNA-directed RNA polymerase specialized sigma24 family protein